MLFGGGMGDGGQGAAADFDALIELVRETTGADEWSEVAGECDGQTDHDANLGLVIDQTEKVHEEITDLLDELRQLQDLQLTIEVRFVTLQDDFFERIGVDFDFEVDDQVDPDPKDDADKQDPTPELDLSFTSGSFDVEPPVFGGFEPEGAADFGFAILSDIEVFFLMQAAEGDSRVDTITKDDPIPRNNARDGFFERIGVDFDIDIDDFTDQTDDSQGDDRPPVITPPTTVQLPKLEFISVTTTVSMPDGGTVLLGGIKRLSEGRNELGVPMLNKLPYISRLFKNIGVGRETESLMLMVTPRIVIEEE